MKTLQGHLTNNKQLRVDSNTTQVSASSPKDVLNSTVLSCCRKAASDYTSLMKDGSSRHRQAKLETCDVTMYIHVIYYVFPS